MEQPNKQHVVAARDVCCAAKQSHVACIAVAPSQAKGVCGLSAWFTCSMSVHSVSP